MNGFVNNNLKKNCMKVYALIAHVYDGYACEWYDDIDTLQLFAEKEKRDNKMKELESQIGEYERVSYYDFEVELQ